MQPSTILVVEDNPITRKMTRVALQSSGYRVVEAEDGASALAQMASQAPDMVLQDLGLPDMEGLALLERLRALPRGAELPILAVSGFLPQIEQARSLQVSFTDYLFKPVEPSRLLEIVQAYLQPAGAGGERPGQGRRVLAVDDNAGQLKLLRIHLEQLGFQVATAADGEEALEAARRAPPDAIVSDVLMPRLDGFRLCQAVRADPRLADIPVILTSSGYTEEPDRGLAASVGADALVLRTPDCQEAIQCLLTSLSVRAMTADFRPHRTEPAVGQAVSLPGPANRQANSLPHELTEQYAYRVIHQLERQSGLNIALSDRLAVLEAKFAVLAGLAETLKPTSTVETVVEQQLHHALNAAGVSRGAAYLLDAQGRLALHAQLGCGGDDQEELAAFFGHTGLLQQVLAEGVPRCIPSTPEDKVLGARCSEDKVLGARCSVLGSDTDRDEDAFVEPSTEHRAPSTLSSEHRAPSTVSLLARARAGSLLLAPLLLGEERLGVLVMVSQKADLGEEWGTFARAVGSQIGQAIGLARGVSDLKQNRDQLRQLAARLQAIREEERARAAREVHDELGQLLTCLKMDVAWLRNRLPPGEEDLHAKAASMSEMLDETFGAVRRIATALRPQILDSLGLEAAIEWQAEEFQSRTSIVCAVSGLPLGVDLDGARSTALFRIFQETLTNVARHAGATHVAARLATEDGDLVLEVADNGRGISAGDAAGRGSLGLLGMRERALLIGGDIRVVGAAGRGTTVTVRVPMGQRA